MNVRMRSMHDISIKRVVIKLVIVLITLWAGGTIVRILGNIMNGTQSPFYQGLELIGWTVDATGTITDTSGNGILAVVGIIGIATVVLEFVHFSWN